MSDNIETNFVNTQQVNNTDPIKRYNEQGEVQDGEQGKVQGREQDGEPSASENKSADTAENALKKVLTIFVKSESSAAEVALKKILAIFVKSVKTEKEDDKESSSSNYESEKYGILLVLLGYLNFSRTEVYDKEKYTKCLKDLKELSELKNENKLIDLFNKTDKSVGGESSELDDKEKKNMKKILIAIYLMYIAYYYDTYDGTAIGLTLEGLPIKGTLSSIISEYVKGTFIDHAIYITYFNILRKNKLSLLPPGPSGPSGPSGPPGNPAKIMKNILGETLKKVKDETFKNTMIFLDIDFNTMRSKGVEGLENFKEVNNAILKYCNTTSDSKQTLSTKTKLTKDVLDYIKEYFKFISMSCPYESIKPEMRSLLNVLKFESSKVIKGLKNINTAIEAEIKKLSETTGETTKSSNILGKNIKK